MTITIHDCEQGTDAWRAIRAGIPTASEFATVLRKSKEDGGRGNETRQLYLEDLAGEIITGEPRENYENGYMARGKALEPEARDLYALAYGVTLRQVGFITNSNPTRGCSPDSLIGEDGLLEIKTKTAGRMVRLIRKNEFPAEHYAQCQGGLWVAEREWCDLCVYYPGMPLFVKRVYRDEVFIADLAAAVAKFNDEIDAAIADVRAYGEPTPVEPDTSGSLLMAG